MPHLNFIIYSIRATFRPCEYFQHFIWKKKYLSHFKQILNISNDFRNIASFIKEKLVEILWIVSNVVKSGHFQEFFVQEICYISKTIWNVSDLFEVPKNIFSY